MRPTVVSLRALPYLVGMLLSLSGRDAQSATEVIPDVSISAEVDDNPAMVADDDPLALRRSASRLVAEASIGLVSFTPRAELAFEPAVRSDAYEDPANEELESTDWYLRGRGRWTWERSRLGFGAEVSREKILGTEFLGLEPDEFVDVDGTLRGLNEERTLKRVTPYTEIDFGERSRVRLDLRAIEASYAESPFDARMDFTDWEAGGAYVRSVTDRTDISTRIFGGRYEAEDQRNLTDKAGIEMRVERALSRLWAVGGGFGVERTEYAYFDAVGNFFSGTESHPVLALDLQRRGERSELDFGLSRRARPDSFGTVVLRNELAAAWRRDLSPRVRGSIALRAIDSEALAEVAAEREYGRAELSLDWAFTEVWSLRAGYEHSYWRNATIDTQASSNSVVVGFNYRGRARSEQR